MTISFVTQSALARRWCVSPRTLEAWRWRGEGPAYFKIGGRILYRIEDIEAYETASRKTTSIPATAGQRR